MAKYFLVASSRSRATEVYQNPETGDLVEVYHFRSGATEIQPIPSISTALTVAYANSQEWIEADSPPTYKRLPAYR